MARGFFVTATDTSVGKTVVAAAVVRALKFLGCRTGAMKPLETGCVRDGNVLIPSDGMFLKTIAEMNEKINTVTPYAFEYPLAPLIAGEMEGKEIQLGKILDAYEGLSKHYDTLVVEGIGGLYVPILKDYYVADLALEMRLPLLVVVRPSLGTLNHTLLTIHYAVSRGLKIAGLVVNYSVPPVNDVAEKTNHDALRSLTEVPILGVFPYLKDFDKENFDKEAIRSLDIKLLKRHI